MDCLNNLSGCELVSIAAILAVSISQNLSPDETDTLGNFFSALVSNLSTIAVANSDTKSVINIDKKEKEC